MSIKKVGPKEDFNCEFCQYYLCTKEEYSKATQEQKHKWSVYWTTHKKSNKHQMFKEYQDKKIRLQKNHPENIEEEDEDKPINRPVYYICYKYDNLLFKKVSVDINQPYDTERYTDIKRRYIYDIFEETNKFIFIHPNGAPIDKQEYEKMNKGTYIPAWLYYFELIKISNTLSFEFQEHLEIQLKNKDIFNSFEMELREKDDSQLINGILRKNYPHLSIDDYRNMQIPYGGEK